MFVPEGKSSLATSRNRRINSPREPDYIFCISGEALELYTYLIVILVMANAAVVSVKN